MNTEPHSISNSSGSTCLHGTLRNVVPQVLPWRVQMVSVSLNLNSSGSTCSHGTLRNVVPQVLPWRVQMVSVSLNLNSLPWKMVLKKTGFAVHMAQSNLGAIPNSDTKRDLLVFDTEFTRLYSSCAGIRPISCVPSERKPARPCEFEYASEFIRFYVNGVLIANLFHWCQCNLNKRCMPILHNYFPHSTRHFCSLVANLTTHLSNTNPTNSDKLLSDRYTK
jgi:hypothetical protein